MVLLLVLFLLQRALPAFFESRIWHGMALAAAPLALGFSLLAGRLLTRIIPPPPRCWTN